MLGIFKGRLVLVRLILLTATLILIVIGIATIYSIGHPGQSILNRPAEETRQNWQSSELMNLWKKQVFFGGVGFAALIAVNLVSYRRLGEASYWIYASVLVLLAVLLFDKIIYLPFVSVINGSRRWLRIPMGSSSINIQPSEICKLAYLLALAWYLRYRSNYRSFRSLIGPFILTLLPMLLILLEPDLGTVLLMMPVFLATLFIAGAKPRHLAVILLTALIISPLMWYKMQPYQRLRISSVLLQNEWVREKAERHPSIGRLLVGTNFSARKWKDDWGYHLIRSKYAVASGGAGGYGFGNGPFVKYNFLPERHNDFIFAIIANQWGFWGCLAILMLYLVIIWCGLEIAGANTDPFARLLAAGIVIMFSLQIIVNVMMTLGLMPITGITLPFLSYGGSSLMVSMIFIGLLNNIGRWRPLNLSSKR